MKKWPSGHVSEKKQKEAIMAGPNGLFGNFRLKWSTKFKNLEKSSKFFKKIENYLSLLICSEWSVSWSFSEIFTFWQLFVKFSCDLEFLGLRKISKKVNNKNLQKNLQNWCSCIYFGSICVYNCFLMLHFRWYTVKHPEQPKLFLWKSGHPAMY